MGMSEGWAAGQHAVLKIKKNAERERERSINQQERGHIVNNITYWMLY